ncbi:MAG: hypothetical protein Q8N53_04795 [Longimicrobiales bacterium]|nr:hypothetical protein [Longimicrobiales bacterium]
MFVLTNPVARAACLIVLLPTMALAQATTPELAQSLFKDLRWRNIGPGNVAGRITDIEAVEANPAIVILASASGGMFKSTNGGTTWTPIFENYGTGNMGDVDIFQPNPDIIYVGTGESCVRNSIAWGDGVYKSTDGGKTFVNVGLRDTHHVSEVVIHPSDPDIVYVAAQGHLWGYNQERGVFRTRDGGKTWTQLTRGLPTDGKTGASDLVMDPTDPNVLYVGMWERIRRPYNFESGGPNGGVFKSTDGGETWTKLTNGLPTGPSGKIGLAISRTDPRILMMAYEHGFNPPQRLASGDPNPDYADMSKIGHGLYRSEDGGASWTFVNRRNGRPFYYSHIFIDPTNPNRVLHLDDNAQVSEDGGRTFSRMFEGIEGDFHALWMDPSNSNRLYVGNDKGASASYDRGLTFQLFDNLDLAQFYAVTADNRDPYWVYGGLQDSGNWGGISNSRDANGILTDHWFKFHSGDGFHTTADPNDWRTVYTESENGGIRRTDPIFRQQAKNVKPTPATVLNFKDVMPNYTGNMNSLSRDNFRFNWSAPIALSPHDTKTVYLGGNYLFKSTDRGDTWWIISPDLSTNDPVRTNPASGGITRDATGAETNATLISVVESPLLPGVIWGGTDDGNVQVTRDGGKSWTNVRSNIAGVPAGTWVSRVTPSRYDAATAYVSFDGHRNDDFRPYIFKTTDYGRTWTSVSGSLPATGPVYVITEDLKNPNLLFVGTEFAAYATVDGGRSYHRLMNGLPTVAVHDLIIHPREGDLIAATHGRSIWILDDITALQQLDDAVLTSDVHLFTNKVATRWRGITRGATRGHFLFMGRNPLSIAQRAPSNNPGELQNSAAIHFWLKSAPAGPVQIEISTWDGAQKFSSDIPATQGINRYYWPLRFDPPAGQTVAAGGGGPGGRGGGGRPAGPEAVAGSYRVRLTVGGKTYEGTVVMREDPDAKAVR